MADDTPQPDPADAGRPAPTSAGAEAAGATGSRPRPSAPGAAAASRARRIGGRVGPGRPDPGPGAGSTPTPAGSGAEAPAGSEPEGSAIEQPEGDPVDPAALGTFAPAAADGPAPAVPAWLRWAPAGVLTVGAVVMAVLLLVFSHGIWWGRANASAVREEILAAAKTCVVKTNTYKYTALDAYAKTVDDCTTGKLTGQFQKTIKTVIRKYAPQLKASQTTQISRGAVEAVSPHGRQWTLLLFGQLTVTNSSDTKGRTDPFAAQVRMEKVHGKWLMSGLTTVGTPAP